jgi:hypothetical protein
MRFVLTAVGMAPRDGAIVPFIEDAVKEKAKEAAKETAVEWLQAAADWTVTTGIPIAAELILVWGLICFLFAITGKGDWMEKGLKAILVWVMLGFVKFAV